MPTDVAGADSSVDPVGDPERPSPAAVGAVLGVLLFGVAVSGTASLPAVTVKAVWMGAPPVLIALYFALVSAGAVAVQLLAGRASRSVEPTRLAALALCWLAVGNLLLAAATSFSVLLVAGVAFQCAISIPVAQLLVVAARSTARGSSVAHRTTRVRAGYALGWVGGASLGGVLAGGWGPDRTLIAVAVAQLVLAGFVVVAARWLPVGDTGRPSVRSVRSGLSRPSNVGLGLFVAAFVLCSIGGQLRVAGLPVLLLVDLRATPSVMGFVLAVTPAAEVPAFFLVAWAARRWGDRSVLICGALVSVAYFIGVWLATSVLALVVLQAVFALYIACAAGLALGVAQTVGRADLGRATATMFAAENLANLLGGALAVVATALVSIRVAFVFPAVLCAIGVFVLIFGTSRVLGPAERHRTTEVAG